MRQVRGAARALLEEIGMRVDTCFALAILRAGREVTPSHTSWPTWGMLQGERVDPAQSVPPGGPAGEHFAADPARWAGTGGSH